MGDGYDTAPNPRMRFARSNNKYAVCSLYQRKARIREYQQLYRQSWSGRKGDQVEVHGGSQLDQRHGYFGRQTIRYRDDSGGRNCVGDRKILNRYPIEGAKFLNDIAIDTKKGIVYVTDSGDSKIWAINNGKANLVLAGAPLKGPNGLLFEDNQLLIGNGDGSLLTMNPATKTIGTVAKGMGGIDGIVALGNKSYMVTEWRGKIWHIRPDGSTELTSDTSADKINSADIGYNPATRMLFVPTFFHNTVKAYSLK